MTPNELLASDTVDGDSDGVVGELTVGDITSLSVYLGSQPRPTTRQELTAAGIFTEAFPLLTAAESATIDAGKARFTTIGCASCHIQSLSLNSTIFSEPSQMKEFRDATLPGGRTPSSQGLSTATAIKVDLSKDIPDNKSFTNADGTTVNFDLPDFTEKDSSGKVVVNLFGDLRRHQLGTGLQEQIDEVGTGKGTFLTENLWGVGSTAPYMHDGRAPTLTEAILLHHGEGETARTNFAALTTAQQQELIAFLKNLVLFKSEAFDD